MTHLQLFEASTSYQIMVLVAAIDAGAFADADERVLLVVVNTPAPEVAPRPDEAPGMASLLGRFDRVLSLNELLDPVHPVAFRPRIADQPLFERLLLRAVGVPVDATIELVVESVQAPPSRSLLLVFGSAEVTVYAEGLMSYGPTRNALPPHAASRVRRVLHLDLVRGLRPLLLSEWDVPAEAVPDGAFRAVVSEVAAAAAPAEPARPYALVLGQYLSRIGLLSTAEESALLADLVRAAVDRGFDRVVVKPHPSAPANAVTAARRAAPGVRIEELTGPAPAETVYATSPPGLVLGCFSTGLITATRYWEVPVVTLGAPRVLRALPRFEDSNRIPLAIVLATLPSANGAAERTVDVADLQRFVETVGYCMQPRVRRAWRPAAAAALSSDPGAYADVVPRARRRELALPGGWPAALPAGLLNRLVDLRKRLRAFPTAVRTR